MPRDTSMPDLSPDALPDSWIETALRVTGHFEDSADPLAAVTGDFDGMGLSLGVLQWNIGSASLQPLVKPLGRATVMQLMPHYGVDLWNACTGTRDVGLQIVRGWQDGSRIAPAVRTELKAFCRSPAFTDQQVAAARQTAANALGVATNYATADPAHGSVSKALFCWFFDLQTQNGGLKGLTYADVWNFINRLGTSTAVDVICDWLAGRGPADAGYRDSRKNADLWRHGVDAAHLSLFTLSYLRAQKSRATYQADTLNRKGTVALGTGYVHLEKHDLTGILAGS